MKHHVKYNILPFFTLGAGLLGFCLRAWLFTAGVDEKGLLIASHPANALSFLLTALTLGVLFLLSRRLEQAPGYPQLFPRSAAAFAGNAAAAVCLLIAAIGELAGGVDAIGMLTFLLALLTCAALAYLGWCRLKNIHPSFIFHAVVTVYLMLHVVSQYHPWGTEPQLQNYFFQLMASVFLMFTGYYRSALDAGQDLRKQYVFFCQGAVFLCCLCLIGQSALFYGAMGLWCAFNLCSLHTGKRHARRKTPAGMELPAPVQRCIRALEAAGFRTYAVGGCVRDSLLGLVPHDYDLCTAATPEQICRVFAKHRLVRSGEKHGTVGVVLDGQVYEITTFRTEGGYSDGRHPDWVKFVPTVEEDLSRRDFTVNAMAYAPGAGYLDPWGGRSDLTQHVLRAVGDPETRFREDSLRILRGVRFAVRYRLTPEPQTEQAMTALAPLMDNLARERVFEELCKLLPLVTAKDLIRFAPIITQVIPELAPAVGFDQRNPNHVYDVYTHTAHVVEAVPQTLALRWAALLHDTGKVHTLTVDADGIGHYPGHAAASAETADRILQRLRAPSALREEVVFLIAQHRAYLEPDKTELRRQLGESGIERIRALLTLQRADVSSKGTAQDLTAFVQTEALLDTILQEAPCLTVKDLAINGRDILELGIAPGPRIGACMTHLLSQVQRDALANDRQALMDAAKHYFEP